MLITIAACNIYPFYLDRAGEKGYPKNIHAFPQVFKNEIRIFGLSN